MKHIFFILFFFAALAIKSQSQSDTIYTLNINQATDLAIDKNLNIKNAELEVKKAKWKVWQTTAIGLPQVNAKVDFQDFIDIPTQLMPNFMLPAVVGINAEYYGLRPLKPLPDTADKFPVQFGSKYNASYGITLTQLIFNGEYLVGLKTAKIFKNLSEQNLEKAKIEMKAAVEQSYILCLIAEETKRILDSNYSNIKKLERQTKLMVEAGMADQIKADQISVIALTLENQTKSLERQRQLAYAMLKFQLGLKQSDSIVLNDNLETFIKEASSLTLLLNDFSAEDNINYKLVKTQELLAKMDLQRSKSKFLPTVSGVFSYSKKAMEDEFNFLDDESQWYKTTMIGATLSIPLFGSGQKIAETQQKKIAYWQAQNKTKLTEEQLNIQFEQTKADFLNAFDKYVNAQKNTELTEKIYKNTQIGFQNGTSSSFDLTQAQNQYLEKEASYYQAIMDLLISKIKLEKLIQN